MGRIEAPRVLQEGQIPLTISGAIELPRAELFTPVFRGDLKELQIRAHEFFNFLSWFKSEEIETPKTYKVMADMIEFLLMVRAEERNIAEHNPQVQSQHIRPKRRDRVRAGQNRREKGIF